MLWGGEGTSEPRAGRVGEATQLPRSASLTAVCSSGCFCGQEGKGNAQTSAWEKEDFALAGGEQRWRQHLLVWVSKGRTTKSKGGSSRELTLTGLWEMLFSY